MTKNNLQWDKNVVSALEDYIRDEIDEDMFCFNNKWKILPYIVFVVDKGPCVLTCSKHYGGKNLFMVHPCRRKHNFPEKRPDQLFQSIHLTSLTQTSESTKVFNQISNVPSNWKIQCNRYLQCQDIQNFWSQIYALCESEIQINNKFPLYQCSLEKNW